MKHNEIIRHIEHLAPLQYQESYDNSGWQVGNPQAECTGVIINLDVTEAVVDEAISSNANLIIVHHPLIFGGVKSLTGRNYVERIIIKAIQKDIAIYACHTNLDNVSEGVNFKIAEKLGLQNVSILQPMSNLLSKLVVYIPEENAMSFTEALFAAGAGHIGQYSECSFTTNGIGTFKPGSDTNPTIGTSGGPREHVNEQQVAVIVPTHLQKQILQAMYAAHPYEEVAHELYPILNANQYLGAGVYGDLNIPLRKSDFLKMVQNAMDTEVIRYTEFNQEMISKVAICGGSGSFLLKQAKSQSCDAFITADFKYHQFFDSENQIMIADIGHYETEHFTSEIFYDIIIDKFPNFAVRISKIKTNPVKYYF